jgi:hypothetical protein
MYHSHMSQPERETSIPTEIDQFTIDYLWSMIRAANEIESGHRVMMGLSPTSLGAWVVPVRAGELAYLLLRAGHENKHT